MDSSGLNGQFHAPLYTAEQRRRSRAAPSPKQLSVGYLAQSQMKTMKKKKKKCRPWLSRGRVWACWGTPPRASLWPLVATPQILATESSRTCQATSKVRGMNVRSCTIGRTSDELEDGSNQHGITWQSRASRAIKAALSQNAKADARASTT